MHMDPLRCRRPLEQRRRSARPFPALAVALVASLGAVWIGGCDGDDDGGGGGLASDAELVDLLLSAGVLTPAFDPGTTSYGVMTSTLTSSTTVTATTSDANATLEINGMSASSGVPFGPLALGAGPNPITVEVTAEDGTTMMTTMVLVTASLAQGAYAKASNTAANDEFGYSVAVSGDTLAVGARFEDSDATGIDGDQGNDNAANSGAVYVFTRTAGVWSQQAYIKASNSAVNDQFGFSLALSGDLLVVGAPGEDSNATGIDGDQGNDDAASSGAVYAFTRTAGVWSQEAYIKASNTGASDFFGFPLALSGDTLVVGADLEDSDATGVDGDQGNDNAANSGAAYVFTRTAAVWGQQAYLKASNTGASDFFGGSLALSGDTLAVGALGESSDATGIDGDGGNDNAFGSGAVYVFTRTAGVWSQQAYVKASNTGAGDEFGTSLALSGDTLAAGARAESSDATGIDGDQGNDNAASSGAVYVFTRAVGVWSQQAYVKASNTGADDEFGTSLALSGDTLVVGAEEESSDATGIDGDQGNDLAAASGAVYVLTRDAGAWTQQAYVKASNTGAFDFFGFGLALSGDTLAVAAQEESSDATGIDGDQNNDNAPASGAVYVFQ